MAFAEAGASLPLIQDGKLRALAVTSSTRLPTVPDLPPIGEAVGAPDFEAVSWHVLLAHAATPPDIVDKAARRDEAHHGQRPGCATRSPPSGSSRIDIASVESMRGYIKSESEKWGALVRKLGLEGSQ